jgi:hypothetical protein
MREACGALRICRSFGCSGEIRSMRQSGLLWIYTEEISPIGMWWSSAGSDFPGKMQGTVLFGTEQKT